MYANFLAQIQGYGVQERGDKIYGGAGIFQEGFSHEFFFRGNFQYSKSDAGDSLDERGVKLTASTADGLSQSDPSTLLMPSLHLNALYVKEASKTAIKVSKVLNYSAYFFTFPLSLRREVLYASFTHYELEPFHFLHLRANETAAGVTFDTTILNKLNIPMKIEYIYNDNKKIANRQGVRFQLGYAF
jgi:hypothetical protein